MKRVALYGIALVLVAVLFGVTSPKPAASTSARQQGNGRLPTLLGVPGLDAPMLVWSGFGSTASLSWGVLTSTAVLLESGQSNNLIVSKQWSGALPPGTSSLYPFEDTQSAALYVAGAGLRVLVWQAGASRPVLVQDDQLFEPVVAGATATRVVNWMDPATEAARLLARETSLAGASDAFWTATARRTDVSGYAGPDSHILSDVVRRERIGEYANKSGWRWAGLTPGPLAVLPAPACEGVSLLWADGVTCEARVGLSPINEVLWDGEAATLFGDDVLLRVWPNDSSSVEVTLDEPEGIYRHYARCTKGVCAYFDPVYGHIHWVDWNLRTVAFSDIALPSGMKLDRSVVAFDSSAATNLWITPEADAAYIVLTVQESERLESEGSGCGGPSGESFMVMRYALYAATNIPLDSPPAKLTLTRIRP